MRLTFDNYKQVLPEGFWQAFINRANAMFNRNDNRYLYYVNGNIIAKNEEVTRDDQQDRWNNQYEVGKADFAGDFYEGR